MKQIIFAFNNNKKRQNHKGTKSEWDSEGEWEREEKRSARAHKCDFYHVISFIRHDTHRNMAQSSHTHTHMHKYVYLATFTYTLLSLSLSVSHTHMQTLSVFFVTRLYIQNPYIYWKPTKKQLWNDDESRDYTDLLKLIFRCIFCILFFYCSTMSTFLKSVFWQLFRCL